MNARIGTLLGPAGTGKDTLLTRLMQNNSYSRIVNTTTRSPRPGEIDGQDYYFIDEEHHQRLVAQNAYLTHTYANDRYYGVQASEVMKAKNIGKTAIGHFGIDDHRCLWDMHDEGALSVRSAFVITPDFDTWKSRMDTRLTDGFIAPEEYFKRAQNALTELEFAITNFARFAIITTAEGMSSVEAANAYFQKSVKPKIQPSFLDDMREAFESFLNKEGEVSVGQ